MELPKTPGDSSPGTLPFWGTSFSPPPGLDPCGSSQACKPGTSLSPLLGSRGAGEPGRHPGASAQGPWSCRPATPAARTVRGAGGDPGALRALPSPSLLSTASSPARGPQIGAGLRTRHPPSSQAHFGEERGSGTLPPSPELVAGGGDGRKGDLVGRGRRRALLIGAGPPRWCVARGGGGVSSGFLLCIVPSDFSTCPGVTASTGTVRERSTEIRHPQTHIPLLGRGGKEQPGKDKERCWALCSYHEPGSGQEPLLHAHSESLTQV